MASQKRQLMKYAPEAMVAALADCDRGLPVATSAKKHNVPRVTLLYKFKGKSPRNSTMGVKSYLTKEEEDTLCMWIIQAAKAGFPIDKDQLLDSVQRLMVELKRHNPFINNRPGNKWYKLFLKRNPQVGIRTPQNLTSTRASVTKLQLDAWFEEVISYLRANNYDTILQCPERVFNSDEAAFFLSPKGERVLAKKGEKNVYQIVNSDEKECITVLITGSASGNLAPPMVIFRYERIPKEIALSVPETWGIGKSETGWMTGETFYEFITNVFHPWLLKKNIELPVILFIDRHTSHLTLHTSHFCDQNGIILVALFPNATHLIQPMDVAIFRTLKSGWREHIKRFRLEHNERPIVKKTDFCPLLKKAIDERLNSQILQNGFRKCGLVPWDPSAVQLPNQPTKANTLTDQISNLREMEEGMRFLEKYIDNEKIEEFKRNELWAGKIEDYSLYTFYKTISKNIEDLKNEISGKSNTNVNISQDLSVNSTKEVEEIQNEKELNVETKHKKGLNSEIQNKNGYNAESQNEIESNMEDTVTCVKENINPLESNDPPLNSKEKTPIKIVSNILIKHASENMTIPSPFKRALTWPEPKPYKKKRMAKERFPSVITSKEWQIYHENKDKKKKEEEETKRKRAEERKKRKEMQDNIKEQKKAAQKKRLKRRRESTTDSDTSAEWEASGGTSDEGLADISEHGESFNIPEEQAPTTEYKESDYILVKFPGKKREHKYVCVIQTLLPDNEAEVVGMKKCEDGKFKLNEFDVSTINLNQVIEKLDFPKMTASGYRLKYEFHKQLFVDG